MAESIILFLIPKLTTLLRQEYTLLQRLESDIQYIIDELENIYAFLRIAEAKQDAGLLTNVQKVWFKQVMQVAYDTEDVVDRFFLHFSPGNDAGFRGCVRHMYTSVKNSPAGHQMLSKISDIKQRMKHISESHQRYQPIEGVSEASSTRDSELPIRGDALLIKEADLVGIDEPKKVIVSLILTDESHLKAVSVVGMGGLGKTTLVKRVFEDVKSKFSACAWLTISQTFIIEDVLKKLIRQLNSGDVQSMDRDELLEYVKNILSNKRYVIVLDDLWKVEHWNSINDVFPDDSCGSRIIITTRTKDVATTCCHDYRGIVHKMQALSTIDSWELFCEKTFRNTDCPPHLEDVCRRILSKCEGLPLGIVAIGGLLALKDKSRVREWEMVLSSLGGELEGDGGKLEQVRKILLLSYNDMPYYLKSCFLYLGILAEDEEIDTSILKYLWIGEGFVETRSGMSHMEVADSYMNQLIGRSLIQVGLISTYIRLHDIIHNIVLSKCKEHNIVASTANTTSNVRRLVIDKSASAFLKEAIHLPHLRSLIRIQNSSETTPNLSDSSLSHILKGTSKLLKVLHLKSSRLNSIPKDVFKLYNLTYINLENTRVSHIPKTIGNLRNLEYLNLQSTNVKKLPANIILLKKLFYLGVDKNMSDLDRNSNFRGFKAPHGIGGLLSLEFLQHIEVDSVETIQEIGKLTQLRSLSIGLRKITSASGRELCSTIDRLTNLNYLCIEAIEKKSATEILDLDYPLSSTHQFDRIYIVGRLTKIPHWVSSCESLIDLSLVDSCLSTDPLETLQGLPNLTLLYLNNAYTGDTLNFKADGFQKLHYLYLVNLFGLKSVSREERALPNLGYRRILHCPLLEHENIHMDRSNWRPVLLH